jgi:hypothetical protein
VKYFESDEELKEFMEYFKDELPNPDHHPYKVMWLVRWWKGIVIRNRDANLQIQK